ncbi:MAG: AAA family ATPase [Actinomycetota bacterium]
MDGKGVGGKSFLITGPMAAGKTTVAHLLAKRFERGVHLEGDVFRRSIVSGRIDMSVTPSEEALDQLRLRYRLTAEAAREYAGRGFTVVAEDVVAGPLLEEYVGLFEDQPPQVVVLLPSLDAVIARERDRAQDGYDEWSVREFYEGLVATTPRLGLWLDTSAQTPSETVDEILRRTG